MDRKVKAIKKDRHGNIIALCNAGESWSPRGMADVIKDIQTNKKSYYVEQMARRSYLRVAAQGRLQTASDDANTSGLDKLPTI